MEAEITREYDEVKSAESIAKAISPDNFKTPSGLYIKTTSKGNKVFTFIRCKGKLSTLIATIDDLLSCISTAERTIQTMKKYYL